MSDGRRKFLERGLRAFDTTASFVPSSRFLVEAMASRVRLHDAECVVELGVGTGTVTRRLLAGLGPRAVLYGIEIDEGLALAAGRKLADSRLSILQACATDLETLIDPVHHGRVDAVVSSLGLSLMDEEVRSAIVRASISALRPGGVFIQYAFPHARFVAYSQTRASWFRWDARQFLAKHFRSIQASFVPLNFPPAVVYECSTAIRGGKA